MSATDVFQVYTTHTYIYNAADFEINVGYNMDWKWPAIKSRAKLPEVY
jgi:hypothetical protein